MKHLQVEIITGNDGGIFERRLNAALMDLQEVVTLDIKSGPPGVYNAVIYYLTEGRTSQNG